MVHFPFLLTLSLTLITVSTCCYDTTSGQLLNDNFIVHPCKKPEMIVILHVLPKKTVKAFSKLQCSILCQRNRFCKYAIFIKRDKLCELIYGLTYDLRPIAPDYFTDDCSSTNGAKIIHNSMQTEPPCCWVLIRVVTEPWTCIKLRDLMSFTNLDHFAVVKLKKFNSNFNDFSEVSQFSVIDNIGFTVATNAKTLAVKILDGQPPTFDQYLKNDITYTLGNFGFQEAASVHVRVNDGVVEPYNFQRYPKSVVMWKHIRLESDVTFVETLADAVDSLRLAHGSISRHPTHIKVVDGTVVDEVLNTIQEEYIGNRPHLPLYFTSSKKWVTQTQQRTVKLKHSIFNDVKLPPDENVHSSSFPSVMDTSWEDIVTQELGLVDSLKNELLQGKPIRLRIIESKLLFLTDMIFVRATRNNVLAALIPVPYPEGLDETMKLNIKAISFSFLKALDNKLLNYLSGSVIGDNIALKDEYKTQGDWFVTKKTWNKLYVIDSTKQVTYGDLETLKESIEVGKNIRVCLWENVDQFYCLAGAYVAIKHETGEAILETNPFVDPLDVFEFAPKNASPVLQQILLMSSAGWVERAWIRVGYNDASPQRQTFKEMSWFSEED